MAFPVLKKFRPFLLSPYFLSYALPLIIGSLLPSIYTKYKSQLVKSDFINKQCGFEFRADLDRDGKSESLVLFNNTEGKATAKIMNH